MLFRHTFTASAKVAFFTPDGSHVLVARYPHIGNGLPGGHLEKGEQPEEALRREIREEIGLDFTGQLIKRDFFFRENGNLILAFTATLPRDAVLSVDQDELLAAEWVPVAALRDGSDDAGAYTRFILENSPRT